MNGRSKIETKERRSKGQILRLLRRKALGERVGRIWSKAKVLLEAVPTNCLASKNQREIRYPFQGF